MDVDRDQLQQEIHALYNAEHAAMGERGTLERLERASQWDLAPTLRAGGVLVFPHAGVLDCGHQIAAVVRACLDSGADRVLVLSVHPEYWTRRMYDRVRQISVVQKRIRQGKLGSMTRRDWYHEAADLSAYSLDVAARMQPSAERREYEVPVEMSNEAGEVVATATLRTLVGPKSRG